VSKCSSVSNSFVFPRSWHFDESTRDMAILLSNYGIFILMQLAVYGTDMSRLSVKIRTLVIVMNT